MDQTVEQSPITFEFPIDPKTKEQYNRIRNGTMSEVEFFRLVHRDGLIEDFLSIDGFEKILSAYLEQGISGTLISVDLDYFKTFNDSEGHPTGDDLLRLAGKILHQHTRTTEPEDEMKEKRKSRREEYDLLARGGDEFLIFMVGAEMDNAIPAAKRIRTAIEVETKENFQNYPHRQTMSLGLTAVKSDDTVRSIRQRADQALYKAKEGRGSENIGDSIALL
ncbi:MAG: GGDEF domain-containing protein [Candidatus Daviesbacteria bacterium]|nr:GGDEF domain-containing protein [Candidatus Daviesbacteria bacterium]